MNEELIRVVEKHIPGCKVEIDGDLSDFGYILVIEYNKKKYKRKMVEFDPFMSVSLSQKPAFEQLVKDGIIEKLILREFGSLFREIKLNSLV